MGIETNPTQLLCLILFFSVEGKKREVGMQIIPQVNTSIITSVTLLHCPTGMCELHTESSKTGDNNRNQVSS